MAKKIMKTKLIKKYFGDVIREYGFEYICADSLAWKFTRQKEKISQEIYIVQDRFFPNKVGMFFFTGVYGWGTQQPCDFVEKYRHKEYWKYETEEEYIANLQEFAEIVKKYGLDMLEKMCTPKDSIYPTSEMEQYLYESYELLIEEAHKKYDFEKSGEEGIENILKLMYERKNKSFDEVKEFLVEMAALYAEIIINDISGKLIMEKDKCCLGDIGKNKRFIWLLLYSVEEWKEYHNSLIDESKFSESVLLINYRELKKVY